MFKSLFGLISLALVLTQLQAKPPVLIYAFSGVGNQKVRKLHLVGEVIELGKMPTVPKAGYTMGYDMRMGKITVKIDTPEGLQVGQDLIIVRKNPDHQNIRAAKILGLLKIYSINRTSFSGWILIGTGHFTKISRGDFVAREFTTSLASDSIEIKRKADYFFQKGFYAKAISFYKKALSLNPRFPEARLGLARTFGVNPEYYIAAKNELRHAFENLTLVKRKSDKLAILIEYFAVLELEYNINNSFMVANTEPYAVKLLKRMEDICNRAEKEIPHNQEIRLNLAWTYFYVWKLYLEKMKKQGFQKQNRTQFDKYDGRLSSLLMSMKNKDYRYSPRYIRLSIFYEYYTHAENRYRSSSTRKQTNIPELVARCQYYLQYYSESTNNKKEVALILQKLAVAE